MQHPSGALTCEELTTAVAAAGRERSAAAPLGCPEAAPIRNALLVPTNLTSAERLANADLCLGQAG
jgi:hypothetical protein